MMPLEKTEQGDWEGICHRCGGCCFEKIIDAAGTVHTTGIPCRFLDIHKRTCRVYLHRLEIEEDCIKLTPENVEVFSWLPENCAYRR